MGSDKGSTYIFSPGAEEGHLVSLSSAMIFLRHSAPNPSEDLEPSIEMGVQRLLLLL